MPIYEYQCQSCGEVTEALQKLSDPPLETCEECGGELKKLVSAPAFQFKGTGWYVTDYAGRKPSAGADEGTSAKTSGGDADGASATKSSDSSSSSETSSDKASTGKATKGGADKKAAAS